MTFHLPRLTSGDAQLKSHWDKLCRTIEAQEAAQDAIILELQEQLAKIIAGLIATGKTSPTKILSASETAGVAEITVIEHDRIYADGVIVHIEEQVFGGLLTDTPYYPYYIDITRSDTAPSIEMTLDSSESANVVGLHMLGRIRTPITASGITYEGGGSYPPGAPPGRELGTPEP